MKKKWTPKNILCVILAAAFVLGSVTAAFADAPVPEALETSPAAAGEIKEEAADEAVSVIQAEGGDTLAVKENEPVPFNVKAECRPEDGKYTVTVEGYDKHDTISRMRAVVWSDANGQDDITWNTMTREGDNYVFTGDLSTVHDYGNVTVHIYVTLKGGGEQIVGNTAFEYKKTQPGPEKPIEVKAGCKPEDGKYTVTVEGFEKHDTISRMRAVVWSDAKGQDDITWNTMTREGNNYVFTGELSTVHDYGNVTVHIYVTLKSGAEQCIGNTAFENKKTDPVRPDPEKPVAVKAECKPEDGKYTVTVEGFERPETISRMRAVVWSDANGQDDITWNEMTRDGKNYVFTGKLSTVHDYGNVTVHIYVTLKSGAEQCIGDTAFENKKTDPVRPDPEKPVTGTVKAECEPQDGSYAVTVENVTEGDSVSRMRAVVWSDANGQDDITWNEMKKNGDNYVFNGKLSTVKDYGNVTVHVYASLKNGSEQIVGHTSFENKEFHVVDPDKPVEIKSECKPEEEIYTVTVKGFENFGAITRMRAIVWSDANGQDDITWNEMTREGDDFVFKGDLSTVKDLGKVTVHVYVTLKAGGEQVIGTTSFENKEPEITDPEKPAVIKAEFDTEKETYTVTAEGLKNTAFISQMRAAVWTDANGQDDITWNEMTKDGDAYVFTGKLDTLKDMGKAVVHVYATMKSGSERFAGDTFMELKSAAIAPEDLTLTVDNVAGTFAVKAENITTMFPISRIRAAVWCASDQSDIVWYDMNKNPDGSYELADGNIAKHGYHTGKYHVHIYVSYTNGRESVLAQTGFEIKVRYDDFKVIDLYEGVENEQEKVFRISLENVEIPGGASQVQFVVWNASHPDKKIWNDAVKDSETAYHTDVNVLDYRYDGRYICHVYYTPKNSSSKLLMGGDAFTVSGTPSCTVSAVLTDDKAGEFDVTISEAAAPAGISSVRVACWSDESGSSRCWYDAEKQEDGTYLAHCSIADNNYGLGHYYIHAYATMGNGIEKVAGEGSLDFNPEEFIYIKEGAMTMTLGIKNTSRKPTIVYVWSASGGQTDMRNYSFSSDGPNSYRTTINMFNFSASGKYIAHIYEDDKFVAEKVFNYESSWRYENGYKFLYANGEKVTDLTAYMDSGAITGPYRIDINRITCSITIYALDRETGAYIIPVRAMTCSVGVMTPDMETPTGDYSIHSKWRWKELMGPSWGQYVSCIMPNYGIHFHSVAGYRPSSHNLSYLDYNMLGQPASHGCVRLCVRDAKWIYDYMPSGTWVHIYDSSYPGPFGKPATIKISPDMDYDPTDPNA